MNSKSFTLIELLVVISILGLLSSLILLSLGGAKDRADIGKAQEFSHAVRVSLGASLVGEWRFDDGTDPTKDSSGNNNHGYLKPDGSEPAWINEGMFGKALDFDGLNDYINCGNNSLFNLVDEFTIEAWIKSESLQNINFEVASSGNNDTPQDKYVYVDGVLRHETGRSWAVTRLDSNWSWVATNQYDCYGSSAQATAMKDYLASLPNGTNVIINTRDEPKNNVFNNADLITQLESVGATASIIQNFGYRSSYLLVGQKGLGAANAFVEKYGPQYGTGIYYDSGDLVRKGRNFGIRVKEDNINGMINLNYLSVPLTQDTWTHIILTYDGTTEKLYKNGNLEISTNPSAPSENISSLWIGGAKGYEGIIDEVRIYDQALLSAEVQQLYAESDNEYKIGHEF